MQLVSLQIRNRSEFRLRRFEIAGNEALRSETPYREIWEVFRQIQEYCLAGGSWSTVGPLASAPQEGPKPYSCLPNQQSGSPSWKQSKGLLEGKPTVQLNRTLGFPEYC